MEYLAMIIGLFRASLFVPVSWGCPSGPACSARNVGSGRLKVSQDELALDVRKHS